MSKCLLHNTLKVTSSKIAHKILIQVSSHVFLEFLLQLRSPSAMSNRSGGYTSHITQNQAQPEIHVIKLHKSTNGMGLSIVAAKVCTLNYIHLQMKYDILILII